MTMKSVVSALKKCDNFLITSHLNPEPDALGSALAMYELVRKLGKRATVVNNDEIPSHYLFMEGVDIIKKKPARDEVFDGAIVLDCPNVKRTGTVARLLKGIDEIINIDHHVSNERFGTVNLVVSGASSTAEIVYTIYKQMGIEISRKVALYIYIAILTDTGSFNYSNTSGVTHEIVSELLGYGIHPHVISNFVYESKPYSDVKLLGKVLSTLSLRERGKISYLVCTNDMIDKTGSSITSTENFVNFARSVKGVSIALFIREIPEKRNFFKISLRSKYNVNVNDVAAFFGGGGHEHAAGCIIKGTLKEVKKKLLDEASRVLKAVEKDKQQNDKCQMSNDKSNDKI